MTQQNKALELADEIEANVFESVSAIEAAGKIRELVAQRDQLVKVLKELDDFFETYRPDGHPYSDPHEIVRAAIKAVEE